MFGKYLRKLVFLDAFPKVDVGYKHSSTQGGCMTVFVSICLWLLILSEFREYWTLHQKYKFVVDSSVGHHLDINVDITVAMPCSCKHYFYMKNRLKEVESKWNEQT